MIPGYDEPINLLWSVGIFAWSVLMAYTQAYEQYPNTENRFLTADLLNVIQFTLLGVACAASRSFMMLPY
jgi:hypothetical protein